MKQKTILIVLLLLLLYKADFSLMAQSGNEEYLQSLGKNALIFSGKEQTKYPTNFIGDPYYSQQNILTGSLSYDNITYQSVMMRLDTYQDELSILTENGAITITLHPAYFNHVEFNGKFIFYQKEDNRNIPFTGYYIQHYNDELLIIEKPECTMRQRKDGTKIVSTFQKRSKFYIVKEDEYIWIKNEAAILKLFKDRKKELKEYIRYQNLDFKKDPISFIENIVKHEGISR